MYKTTKALVLRAVKYKEADLILTLLTESDGKLTAKARGALRKGSRYGAASQQFCYSEMTLFFNAGKWSVNEAETLEQFLPLREDLEKLALAAYFTELLEAVSDEDSPNPELLRLGLNALYVLSAGRYAQEHIKSVFELRLLCLSGYAPDLEGRGDRFSLYGGGFHSLGEAPGAPGRSLPADEAVRRAMDFIVNAELKKIFSFHIPEASEKQLSALCEGYALAQLDRGFSTLDYWKSVHL